MELAGPPPADPLLLSAPAHRIRYRRALDRPWLPPGYEQNFWNAGRLQSMFS